MSWLHRHIKYAQNQEFTLDALYRLREQAMMPADIPGQAYLFEGPEWSELARLRTRGVASQAIDKLIHLINMAFTIYADDMKDEFDWQREIDENELEEEMQNYAEVFTQDYDFHDDEKMWSFIRHLDNNLVDVIKETIGSNIPSAEEFGKLFKELQEAEKEVTRFFQSHQYTPNEMEHKANSVAEAWQEAIQLEQEGYDGSDTFQEALAQFTNEVIQAVAESQNTSTSYYYRNSEPARYLDEELPSWINGDTFRDNLRQNDEIIEWYIDENKGGYQGLEDVASESISERDAEYFQEKKREWEHQFGFDIIDILATDYDPSDEEDEDSRRGIPLSQLSAMTKTIADEGWLVDGGVEAAQQASVFIFAAQMIAEKDESLKSMFAQDLRSVTIDQDSILKGMEALQKSNDPSVINVLKEIPELNQLIEEHKRIQEERNRMLPIFQETSTPEQLQTMKDLGIAKRPFGHETELSRGTFPGSGFMSMQGDVVPFTIAIAPTQDYVGNEPGKIPPELIQETLLHNVPAERQPAIGWVGGYADYANKILYVAEVQSDMMQRSVHMRDPVKVRKQREQEVRTIQEQIVQTENKIQSASSPRKQLEEKIQRINQERQQLVNVPNAQNRIQELDQLLGRLQQQLPNVPDTVDTRNLELTLQNLHRSLAEAQQNLEQTKQDPGVAGGFEQKYRKWHDYKSKVENTFKDWIPVFFNAAMRLARDKGYVSVRIATSETLMQQWNRFSESETRNLFERVYDQTAQFYGAQPITFNGQKWWEVKMDNPDLRVASWLQRLTKKATHEWLTQIPGGKYVWQIHIDKFFDVMTQRAPELAGEDQWGAQEGDYAAHEGKRAIFQEWLNEVPNELKFGNDLEPGFKQAVRQYLMQTRGFDPYELEQDEDVGIPSADELDQWFR